MAHVILFEHANFHGAHKHVFSAESNLNADDDNFFNDKTSSIVVLEGNWAFFADSGFSRQYPAILGPGLYSWVENVQIKNDDLSSLQPVDSPATVTGDRLSAHVVLFEHANLHGAHKHVFAAETNLNAGDDNFFNDKTSSIVVLEGDWAFFADSGFSRQYPPVLGPGLYSWVEGVQIKNDDLSSLQPVNSKPTVSGNPLDAHTILFEHANFHGAHKHVFASESNLNAGDDNFFNDKTSSIVVLQALWAFYRDSSFQQRFPQYLGPALYSWVENFHIVNDSISSLQPINVPAGFWEPLTNQPNFNAGTMLLLTDGTIMCQDEGSDLGGSPHWWRLTPDVYGNYQVGAWSQLLDGPNSPLYYASAVLADGRVFVAGGEYNGGSNVVDLAKAQIYDPQTNSWNDIGLPMLPNGTAWANIGDAPACVLSDGRVLIGFINGRSTAIYDPVSSSWAASANKNDQSSEETWTLLPNGSVLVAECTNHPAAEKFVPSQGGWTSAGSIPAAADLVQSSVGSSNEIGPAILRPNGTVFAVGASGHTAIFTPSPSPRILDSWAAGPDFPLDSNGNLMQAFDAPACLLPNSNVLCVVGPPKTDGWAGPMNFFRFDGTNLNSIATPSNAGDSETFAGRMLLLPSGQILFSCGTNNIQIYTSPSSADPAWRPAVTGCPRRLTTGMTFLLSGTQLNGLSQAVSYGDDSQAATNYPLVFLRNPVNGLGFFCRTHDHSTMGVATGNATVTTKFDVPTNVTEFGRLELYVIANGIWSDPFEVELVAP
jgi:Beta/Gamma crystallin/Kelch motif